VTFCAPLGIDPFEVHVDPSYGVLEEKARHSAEEIEGVHAWYCGA
jgi:hypothetical protein